MRGVDDAVVRLVAARVSSDELRASKVMQERARKNPKIEWRLSAELEEILGEPGKIGVTSARIKSFKTGEVSTLPCKAVFVAIGHQPNTDLFQGELDMDEAQASGEVSGRNQGGTGAPNNTDDIPYARTLGVSQNVLDTQIALGAEQPRVVSRRRRGPHWTAPRAI